MDVQVQSTSSGIWGFWKKNQLAKLKSNTLIFYEQDANKKEIDHVVVLENISVDALEKVLSTFSFRFVSFLTSSVSLLDAKHEAVVCITCQSC